MTQHPEDKKDPANWRRDETRASHLGSSGDSDDAADSPTHGVSPRTPGAGDSDDQGDDQVRGQGRDQPG